MKKTAITIAVAFAFMVSLIPDLNAAAANGSLFDNEAGDYEYFDSNEITAGANAQYQNLTVIENGNTVSLPRLDYKNPKRDKWIRLYKTAEGGYCGIKAALKRSAYTKNTAKTYSNYLIRGKLWISSAYSLYTDAARLEFEHETVNTFTVNSSLKTDNGDTVPSNKWVEFAVTANTAQRKADIYISGAFAYSVGISSAAGDLKNVSFLCRGGTGDVYFEDITVTGIVEAYENGTEKKTSIYPSDDGVREYLSDKQAFHCFGKLMYANGIKNKISGEPWYDQSADELYIPYTDINEAFNTSLKLQNGSVAAETGANVSCVVKNQLPYVGVKSFAKNILKRNVFFFKTGLILVSQNEISLDTNGWQYMFMRDDSAVTLLNDIDFINGFMQYERPSRSELTKRFDSIGAAHPRLLVNDAAFDRLKEYYKRDSLYKAIADKILANADNIVYGTQPVTYTYDDDMRTLNTANTLKDRFITLGFAYRFTGERKYAERAYKEIQAMLAFPDYNTSHLIDTATYTVAAAIAYDWMYNGFTPSERADARRLCLDRCLKTLSDGMYGRISGTAVSMTGGWSAFKEASNFNTIVCGGVICGAAAAMEDDPSYCSEVMAQALRGMEYSLMNYSPSGGWDESVNYWNYAWEFLAYSLTSLDASFGTSFSLEKAKGLDKTLDYAKACIGVGGINNFHDSPCLTQHSFDTFMCLADIMNDSEARKLRTDDLRYGTVSPSMFDAVFYAPAEEAEGKRCTYVEGTELFTVRNGENINESDFYFSTHFGTTSGYHQHSDCSTFVLDMHGERWAEDLGSEDYNLQNRYGYTDEQLYRKREEGHNVLVINPDMHFSQQQGKFVSVQRHESNEHSAFVTADMSGIYKNASDMKIGYYIGDDYNSVTYRSEFTLSGQSEIYWFMHTKADIRIENQTAFLTKNGKTIKVLFETNGADAEIKQMAAKPLPTSPQVAEQNANSEYKKLAVHFTASGNTTLSVKLCSVDGGNEILQTETDNWALETKDEENILLSAESTADFPKTVRAALTDADNALLNKKWVKLAVTDEDNGIFGAYTEFNVNSSKRYVTVSADIIPFCNEFGIVTKSNKAVSGPMTLANGLPNNCIVIYDSKAKRAKTVVNGTDGGWHSAEITDGCIRAALYSDARGGYAYLSGFKIAESDALPVLPNEPRIETSFRTENDTLFVSAEASSGDIRCLNCSCEVYSDASLRARNGNGALADGNVIVLKSGTAYKCYRISCAEQAYADAECAPIVQCCDSFGRLVLSNADCESVSGKAGKSSNDFSAKLTGNASSDRYFFQYTTDLPSSADYTADMLIYPDSSAAEYVFTTARNVRISCGFTNDALIKDAWNRITLVHDSASGKNICYINSKRCSSFDGELSGGVIRFIVYGAMGSEKTMYLDDFCIYKGKLAPAEPTGAFLSDSVFISGYGNVTANEFIELLNLHSDALTAAVYKDDGTAAADGIIADGYELRVKLGNTTVRRYTFKSPFGVITPPVMKNGVITFNSNVLQRTQATAVAASYDAYGRLVNTASAEYTLQGAQSIDIKPQQSTDTAAAKLVLWQNGTLTPIINAVEFK